MVTIADIQDAYTTAMLGTSVPSYIIINGESLNLISHSDKYDVNSLYWINKEGKVNLFKV